MAATQQASKVNAETKQRRNNCREKKQKQKKTTHVQKFENPVNYLTGSSYLSAERCKADGTTPLGLGGSAEKQEDTESASVTCDRQPQTGDDRRASYEEFAAFT